MEERKENILMRFILSEKDLLDLKYIRYILLQGRKKEIQGQTLSRHFYSDNLVKI